MHDISYNERYEKVLYSIIESDLEDIDFDILNLLMKPPILDIKVLNIFIKDLLELAIANYNENAIRNIILNPDTDISIKNEGLEFASNIGSEDMVNLLLSIFEYSVKTKEDSLLQAYRDEYNFEKFFDQEFIQGDHPNIIIQLTNDLRVNPSINGNQSLMFLMGFEVMQEFIKPLNTKNLNLIKYQPKTLESDMDILMSRPKFNFSLNRDYIIKFTIDHRFNNVAYHFMNH